VLEKHFEGATMHLQEVFLHLNLIGVKGKSYDFVALHLEMINN